MAEERKLSRRDELLLQLTEAVLHMEPNCDLLWLARQNFLLEIRPCMLCDKPPVGLKAASVKNTPPSRLPRCGPSMYTWRAISLPFRPITNAVVIRPDEQNRQGLIWLPTDRNPKQGTVSGVVVSIGEGEYAKNRRGFLKAPATRKPREIQPGDHVLYQVWESPDGCADRHFVDGEWLDILAEEYVIAIVEPGVVVSLLPHQESADPAACRALLDQVEMVDA